MSKKKRGKGTLGSVRGALVGSNLAHNVGHKESGWKCSGARRTEKREDAPEEAKTRGKRPEERCSPRYVFPITSSRTNRAHLPRSCERPTAWDVPALGQY